MNTGIHDSVGEEDACEELDCANGGITDSIR